MRARARTTTARPGATKAAPGPRPRPKAPPTPKPKAEKPEVRIFVSYSHRDTDARARLETHLAPLKRENVTTWFDGDMNAGEKLDTGISKAMRDAHVFVGLLSPDYLASNYCWKIEYRRAMNRRARGTLQVVAVVLRLCDWKSTPAAGFKLLPEDGKEVTRWRSADDAFLNVAQGIRRVVATVRKSLSAPAPPKAKRVAAPKVSPKAEPTRIARPKAAKKPAGRPPIAMSKPKRSRGKA